MYLVLMVAFIATEMAAELNFILGLSFRDHVWSFFPVFSLILVLYLSGFLGEVLRASFSLNIA